MGTRKWVADDGSQFDNKALMDAYEERTPHINFLATLVGDDRSLAEKIFKYMVEKNFRVPKVRKVKEPKATGASAGAATPTASPSASSASNTTATSAQGSKKK